MLIAFCFVALLCMPACLGRSFRGGSVDLVKNSINEIPTGLKVPCGCEIENLNVEISLSTPAAYGLAISLVQLIPSPDGTTVKSEPLFEEFPGGKAKFDGSYVFSDEFEQHVADFMKQEIPAGKYAPVNTNKDISSLLLEWRGRDSGGEWRLQIAENAGIAGVLNSWKLNIECANHVEIALDEEVESDELEVTVHRGEVVQWCNHAKTESKTVSYSIPELDSDIMDQGDCFHYKYDKLGSHPYSIVEINGLSTRKISGVVKVTAAEKQLQKQKVTVEDVIDEANKQGVFFDSDSEGGIDLMGIIMMILALCPFMGIATALLIRRHRNSRRSGETLPLLR